MKGKAILRSLLLAYGVTGLFLLIRKDRYIWGIVTGLSYYVLLLLVSFLAQGKWDMTFAHALTTFFMCLGGGAIGGMLS